MFESLLGLNMGSAQVTAVWVRDTRPSALLWGAGDPDTLWRPTTLCCLGLQAFLGTASLNGH